MARVASHGYDTYGAGGNDLHLPLRASMRYEPDPLQALDQAMRSAP
jgi:hypothetical protein